MQDFKIHTYIHDNHYLQAAHHVEAERAFSAEGLFSTKFHSHLSEQSLNMVCFNMFLLPQQKKSQIRKKVNFLHSRHGRFGVVYIFLLCYLV